MDGLHSQGLIKSKIKAIKHYRSRRGPLLNTGPVGFARFSSLHIYNRSDLQNPPIYSINIPTFSLIHV
jgi:hypothetical protein